MPKLHTAADLSTYPSARASSLARPPGGYLRQPTCARCAVRRNPLSNSRTVGANVDDSIDSVAIWNVSWRNAVVEGKREAAREQHYLVLFGPSTGNPSLFGPSYVRRALLCFSSYTYLVLCCAVLCCAVLCCDVLIIVMLIIVTIYSIIIIIFNSIIMMIIASAPRIPPHQPRSHRISGVASFRELRGFGG